MTTSIAWTEETWNPVTGCSRVSDGCRYCYAERLSLQNNWSRKPWTAQNAAENVVLHPDRLTKPRTWKKPSRVFVNSMSDLFHERVPDTFIGLVFDVMQAFPQHTFQVLTKRPERAAHWSHWPANVWIGTSIEDGRAVGRIDVLRPCKAAVKFLSFEPLIGAIGDVDLTGYQWAIVGGESGPHQANVDTHRPMKMEWARAIRDLCVRDGLAFFFKQDSSIQPGARPYLIEVDGTHVVYHQYPGDYATARTALPVPEQLSLL